MTPLVLHLVSIVLLVMVAPVGTSSADTTPTAAVRPPASQPDPAYAGSAACGACHKEQLRRWRGSHHDRAMQKANDETVAGKFDEGLFTADGVVSKFSRDGERFLVTTQGPDGKQQQYEIAYTFGVTPLQQYLVAFPRGAFQALTTAWDSRSKDIGGQRWFDLYPNDQTPPGDVLHWTASGNNWNRMCADCHSTNLRSRYDVDAQRYETTWSEINVGCEACHGPGRAHVDWAARAAPGESATAKVAVVNPLTGDAAKWIMNDETGIAYRSKPPAANAEIETCAPCHSRRSRIADHTPGRPFLDAYRPALLEESLYFPDGQIEDEVYVWGSFVQSRMFHAGVACSDCHDSHSLQLKADGNAVCATCHAPAKFDTPVHHHHPPGSRGAQCVECHMPARTYMVVDPRRDHSFRVPRPDLSATIGVPNACTGCHSERKPQWAADTVARWSEKKPRQHFGTAIDTGRRLGRGARQSLLGLIGDPTQPAIARATALQSLPAFAVEDVVGAVRDTATDADPILRMAAATAATSLPPELRASLLRALLDDPLRLVRVEAARALAIARNGPDAEVVKRIDRGLEEFEETQRLNADQPQAHVNLGGLYAELGMLAKAEKEYMTALAVGAYFVPAYVNLADLYRAQGRDGDAESILRRGLVQAPGDASVHHSLGLTLVRRGRSGTALEELRRAYEIAPRTIRYGYVYGIALSSLGRREDAIAVLKKMSDEHPADADLLIALATIHHDAGKVEEAMQYARQLEREWPSSRAAKQLSASLAGGGP